jgi:hypothetical protein
VPAADIFLTPRVVNQATFDELAGELRTLIGDAGRSINDLRQVMAQTGAIDGQINGASNQLQDRLRLGARMLKAFQAQIDRIDSSLQALEQQRSQAAEAKQSLSAHIAGLEQRIVEAMKRFEASLQASSDAAIEMFGQRLRERQPQFAAVEVKSSEFSARADAVAQLVDKAEVTVSALSFNASQLAVKAEMTVKEARGVIDQCEQSRQALGEALLDAAANVDEVAKHSQQIVATTRAKLGELQQAERRLEKQLVDAARAGEDMKGLDALMRRLDSLLGQLMPWEGLLLADGDHARGDGSAAEGVPLPDPIALLVEQVRGELVERFGGMGAAMRDAAARLDAALNSDWPSAESVHPSIPLHLQPSCVNGKDADAAAAASVSVIHAHRNGGARNAAMIRRQS